MSALRIGDVGAEWRASRAIAVAAVQSRASLGSNWLSWLFLALAVILPLAVGLTSGQWGRAIGLGAGIPLAAPALIWWTQLLSSLARQNHPGSKLLPDFAGRSLRLLSFAYAVIAGVLTVLFSCAGASTVLALLGVCTVMNFCATMLVFPRLSWWVCLAPLLPKAVSMVAPHYSAQVFNAATLTGAGLAFCAVSTYAVLRRLRHGPWPVPRLPQAAWKLNRQSPAGWYARQLRRDCAGGHPGTLLLHALGLQGRIAGRWLACAAGIGALCLVAAACGVSSGAAVSAPMAGVLGMALLFQVGMPHLLIDAVSRTRAEQALVRLAPLAPGAADLNRVLARALLRELAGCWVGTSIATLALAFMLGVSAVEVLRLLPACLVGIGASAMALRDYARTGSGGKAVPASYGVWISASWALGIAALSGRFDGGTWAMLGLATLLGGAAWMVHRWRLMVAAPVAFPALRAA